MKRTSKIIRDGQIIKECAKFIFKKSIKYGGIIVDFWLSKSMLGGWIASTNIIFLISFLQFGIMTETGFLDDFRPSRLSWTVSAIFDILYHFGPKIWSSNIALKILFATSFWDNLHKVFFVLLIHPVKSPQTMASSWVKIVNNLYNENTCKVTKTCILE